jgi:hypothetical protein
MSEFDTTDAVVDEFDIQLTVLKKRSPKKEQKVYVEYNRLTYSLCSISPKEIEASARRNLIAIVDASTITNKLFQNKLALSSVKIKKNQDSGLLELVEHVNKTKKEFDFIFATNTDKSYIHLDIDVVDKTVYVIFDYNIFKANLANDLITEKDLQDLPDKIEIFCIDKIEKSRLFGKITIDTKELFELHSIRYPCAWLPDQASELDNIGFLYYDNSQMISVGQSAQTKIENNLESKPNLLYKQQGNVLQLQSTMEDVSAFRLNDDITFYFYDKNDPAMMLGTTTLSSNQFNNYNHFELELNTKKEIKIISNYFHLHIEESDANAYY